MSGKSNPPSTPPVDSITLDTILSNLETYYRFVLANMGIPPNEALSRSQAKKAILAWHHQQTTKDMLALIGEDEDDRNHIVNAHWYKTRNQLRAELRVSIQAREEQ